MKNFKKILIIILGIIFFILIIILVSFANQKKPITQPTPNSIFQSPIYENIQPGISTLDDVSKQLGVPAKKIASGSANIFEYKSRNPNFNNEITVQNGTVGFIKQIVAYGENIKVSDLNKKYGIYNNMLYSPSGSAFNLYVYPNRGIAYIGHQEADILLEIWYFPPTTLENFKKLYAIDYSDTPIQPGQ